jgi:arylsulfatase A-like enzyme
VSARVRTTALAALVLPALLLGGCAGDRPQANRFPTTISLLALHSFTGHEPPTTSVDPGAQDAGLLRGWGSPVQLEDGAMAAPITDGVATVAFEAGPVPVDTEVVVSGEQDVPAELAGGRPRTRAMLPIGVEVNGARCRRLRSRDTGRIRFAVPAAIQRPGVNVLGLRRPPGSGKRRGATVLVRRIELQRRGEPAPRVVLEGDRLVVQAGASITFYVRAPEAARLEFGVPAGGVVPQVTLLVDGSEPRPLTAAASERWLVPLDVASATVVGLRFESATGAAIVAPTVTGLASIGETAPPANAAVLGRPNVLLYVMDTLRADRLGCYGYAAATSPAFDRFAREGILFRHAMSHAPWTRPAVATILTGQLPPVHGAVGLRDRLRSDLPTLAEPFRAAGYDTAGFVTNTNVAAAFGFDRGFDRYEMLPEDADTPDVYVSAGRLHEAVLAWLDGRPADRPFFLYVHASDVHAPYRPSAEMERRFVEAGSAGDAESLRDRMEERPDRLSSADVQALSALYDAEVATWDAAFGVFWEALRARGRDRDTIVAFVADHGEEFHDHGGIEHGYTLYEELVHVPLVLRLPGGAGGGREIDTMTQVGDLAPTLTALASVGNLGDPSRVPLVRSDGSAIVRAGGPALTHTQFDRREVVAMVLPPWKVILPPTQAKRGPEVYDLQHDPDETRDVAATHPVLIGYARQELARMVRTLPPARTVSEPPVAPDVLERLRKLGYAVE